MAPFAMPRCVPACQPDADDLAVRIPGRIPCRGPGFVVDRVAVFDQARRAAANRSTGSLLLFGPPTLLATAPHARGIGDKALQSADHHVLAGTQAENRRIVQKAIRFVRRHDGWWDDDVERGARKRQRVCGKQPRDGFTFEQTRGLEDEAGPRHAGAISPCGSFALECG
eukprot:492257-Prymnesium_polylepis.3